MVRFTFGQGTSVSSNLTTPLPADHPAIPSDSNLDQCPVDHSTRSKWLDVAGSSSDAGPSNSTPPSPQNPFYSASPASGPRNVAKLSKDREISSIPRAQKTETQHIGSSEGANQKDEDGNWVYPSEEQFFNAMQRKNHKPRAGDMRSIVPIHNAVNERAWEEILAWEAGMGSEKCGGPRLVSFAGKPKQRTPKAWINTALGYQPPFDRHDWYIDRCGTQIRYVIDFYSGARDPNNPQNMAFYLDVRPSLDDRVSIETRLKGIWKNWTS